jgi:CBS domain-containing protein
MLCREIMRQDVQWVLPDSTVAAAARLMDSNNLHLLPVCGGDGKPLGVLTDRDIALRVVARGRPPELTRVDEVMTAPPLFVSPDAPADRIAEIMNHEGTSRLLVIDRDGNLEGIVVLSDLLLVAPSDVTLTAARGVLGTVHRSSRGPSAPTEEYEGTGRDELSTETENPARAEAETVVRGGTNELKEFPG